jgi:hypothetical protein
MKVEKMAERMVASSAEMRAEAMVLMRAEHLAFR